MAYACAVVDLSDLKLERVPTDLPSLLALADQRLAEDVAGHKLAGGVPLANDDGSSVRCLVLKNNRLVYLPSSLFYTSDETSGLSAYDGERPLAGLRVLDAANNRLASVPSSIAHLVSLTVLNLTSNRLTTLPPEVGRLAHLRDLYLGNNELASLPEELGACRDLRRLYLTSNPLCALPLGLGALQHELIVLELSGVHATLTFPPRSVVRKGIQAILAHLAQARAEQQHAERLVRRRVVLAGLGLAHEAGRRGRKNDDDDVEHNKNNNKYMEEELRQLERRARLAEIQSRRVTLDKELLQRRLGELVADKRHAQHRLQELEERASRDEIRRQCVVCMDHARSHVLLPCRHYIVCARCANSLRACPVCRAPIAQRLQVFDA